MALSAAIVLAAGEGTRMRSNKPKVLHAFAGKTFLNRVMDSVAALNPDTLAVVVHFQAERVAEAARSYDEQVTIVNQDCLLYTSLEKEAATGAPAGAMVLPDGHVVTGKTGDLLGAASALLMHALKAVTGVRCV